MYAAALPVAGAFYMLWNPPEGLADGALFAWLLVCLMALRLFDTFFELPSLALGPELVQDYDGRTVLVSSRIFFRTIAGVLFAIAAFQIFLPENSGGVASRQGYRNFAIAGSAVMFVSILISAIATHRFIPWLARPEPKPLSGLSFFADVWRLLGNRPARIMLTVGMLVAVVNGARSGLEIYFGLYFWGLDQAQLAAITAVTAAGTLLGAVVAPQLSRRLGKRLGVLCGYVAAIVVSLLPILLRLAGWLPAGTSQLTYQVLVGQAFCQGLLYVVTAVLMNAMLADVVEDVEVQSGRRAEGLLFSADAFFSKAVSGLGVLIAGAVLALVRFPQDARIAGARKEMGHHVLRHMARGPSGWLQMHAQPRRGVDLDDRSAGLGEGLRNVRRKDIESGDVESDDCSGALSHRAIGWMDLIGAIDGFSAGGKVGRLSQSDGLA